MLSAGLVGGLSSHCFSCATSSVCVTFGSMTWMSSRVPGPTLSTHSCFESADRARTLASYTDSATTSTLWRTPSRSLYVTRQAFPGMGRPVYGFAFGSSSSVAPDCPKHDVYLGQMPVARGPALDLTAQIVDRAAAHPAQVWTPVDFLDLGPRAAVGKALQRLVQARALARLDRGIYY